MAQDATSSDASQRVPVIGIGYSAGGLQPLTTILGLLEAPTHAVVVAQHRRAGDEASWISMLQRKLHREVHQVNDGIAIQAGHVYLAPAEGVVEFEGDLLRVRAAADGPTPTTIDRMLTSLAKTRGPAAIGVVLSGTLSDGVSGLRAVKAGGGHALVQSLDTAEFRELPAAVIEAHAMDSVLPPEEIAAEVNRIASMLPVEPDAVGPKALASIVETMHRHTGVDFSQYKPTTFQRRVSRRMLATTSADADAYAAMLETNEDEVEALYRDLLINVTQFFRDAEFFEALEARVIPGILAAHQGAGPVRVWVPACSTGEEVYSIAMLFLEALDHLEARVDVQIFGTDLSNDAVARAREGTYPEAAMEPVSQERCSRFFTSTDDGLRVTKDVREMCLFAVHDVTRDPPFSNIDLVSCRNLMIYLQPDLQRRVFTGIHYALNDGGMLALGPSEGVTAAQELFSPMDDAAIYRRRSVPSRPLLPSMFAKGDWPPAHRATVEHTSRVARQALSNRYGISAIAITPDRRVAWSQGETFGIASLVEEDTSADLGKALDEAARKGAPRNIELQGTDGPVTAEVVPLGENAGFLLAFGMPTPPTRRRRWWRPRRSMDDAAGLRTYMKHLIEDYEATTEELRSANEEAISSNEELQSTNEELEAAREELTSINKELSTMYDEMRSRTKGIASARDELASLLDSLAIPIVAVGQDLKIRRFTIEAGSILNLIDADIGRPLFDINTGLDEGLRGTIGKVIRSMQQESVQFVSRGGNTYDIAIAPLRTEGGRVEGAVLLLTPVRD